MSRSVLTPWLHRFVLLTALSTLVLIGLGGLVTSHGVGMAVPDWPTTYGYNMFYFPVSNWVGGIFYEHTHRLWASVVGLLTTILAIWLHGDRARPLLRFGGLSLLVAGGLVGAMSETRLGAGLQVAVVGGVSLLASWLIPASDPAPIWLRRLGWIAFLVVLFQGILGGLRVVLFKDEIGIFHAALAQLFLVLVSAIALFTSRQWTAWSVESLGGNGINRLPGWLITATLLVLIQLILGASMRHQHAGLAIPDFPLAYGKLWPPLDDIALDQINRSRLDARDFHAVTASQIGLHLAHRIGAVLVLAAVSIVFWKCVRFLRPGSVFTKWSACWLGVIFGQAVLGAWTVWSNKAADVATLHVICGALALVFGAMLSLIAWKFSVDANESLLHPPAKSSVKETKTATAVR